MSKEEINKKIDLVKNEMNYYIEYLVYKHTYPNSAFTTYCSLSDRTLLQDNGLPYSYNQFKYGWFGFSSDNFLK